MTTGSSPGKATDREFRERVERCVATMVFYHRDGGSWAASGVLAEEAWALATWCGSPERAPATREAILGTLRGELNDRFGDDVGRRVHVEFVRALDDAESAEEDDRHPAPVAARRARRPLVT